ncbi:hypothetical protein PTKIN_Ptkin06aG0160700 [Pterospermum kingtungense]
MKEQGNDITQREKKKEERKNLSVTSSNAKSQHESRIKWPCMNMLAETTAALSASAGCNLQLEPPPLEQPGSLIADQAAACSLWGSAAFSVDTNSFSWQNGCAIAGDRSLELSTSTAAVDKAVPESRIHPAQVKIDQSQSENFQLDGFVPSEARIKLQSYSTNMDARGLILFLCEHVEDHNLMSCEISDALHLAPNPAKFVLDALSTFYYSKPPKNKNNKRIFLKSEALGKERASCILLLEQLTTVTFRIEPHLLVTYCLMSAYDVDELLGILVIASEYRQSPDLCLALGLTDKIHVLIETLVKNNLRLEAIAYIYAFDLIDKFPPAQMLKDHLEYSKESLHHQAKKSHWQWKTERNDAERKQKQKTGPKKALQVPSKPQRECGTKLSSINVSVEAGSSSSASASSSTVTPSPLQLLESFFADEAVPHLSVCLLRSLRSASWNWKRKRQTGDSLSQPFPTPTVQLKVHGQTNCNTAPSVSRSHPSSAPPVQLQCQGGICASTPWTQLQGLSNKHARTDGPVINFSTPQVETVKIPYNQSASQHGSGVPLNQVGVHFGQPTNLGDHASQGPGNYRLQKNNTSIIPSPPFW